MPHTDRVLMTRAQALEWIGRCERADVRVLSIQRCRRLNGRPVPIEGGYAEFSDTFGGHYTNAASLHDARVFVSETASETLLVFELAPGEVARLPPS